MATQTMLIKIMYSALLFGLHSQGTTASTMNADIIPGCREKCGNLTIPYPFGIGKGCYLDEPFAVTCNHSTNSSYLKFLKSQVLEFSIPYLRINAFPIPQFDSFGGNPLKLREVGWGPYFTLSRSKNKLVVVACDVYAYFINSKNLETGCTTFCNSTDHIVPSSSSSSSSCTGIHCCQTGISRNLTDWKIWLRSLNTDTKSSGSHGCNYFFIVDKDFDGFNTSMNFSNCVENRKFFTRKDVPVYLQLAVGNISCTEAMQTNGFACGENSVCDDIDTGVKGYQCSCKRGYRGNSYIQQGCKDVDECDSMETNNCPENTRCVNTLGSYNCETTESRNRFKPIYLGTGLAVSVLILVAIALWLSRKHKRRMDKKARRKFFKQNGGLLLHQHISSSRGSVPETKLFIREDLEKATDNFNKNRILGKGGLGTVFKGMLSDGTIVAVKKSNVVDKNQVEQFINEVFILSQISHRHIVKLLGCCLETEVPLLVYEYINNGTLSQHLHGELSISAISWENRLRIAAEVAGALAYLHSCVDTTIFHRDIKSSNILLDENYRAVISDFGLSRSVPVDKTHLTTLVGGTFGYLDPEYFRSGQLNNKSDVYAFGVVLAELLTGQRAVSSDTDEGLVLRFRSAVKQNSLFNVLEKQIVADSLEEEIGVVARLSKTCLKLTARKRPCMKEVAAELDRLGRIKEDSICKQTSRDASYSMSGRSFSCTDETVEEDDQDIS